MEIQSSTVKKVALTAAAGATAGMAVATIPKIADGIRHSNYLDALSRGLPSDKAFSTTKNLTFKGVKEFFTRKGKATIDAIKNFDLKQSATKVKEFFTSKGKKALDAIQSAGKKVADKVTTAFTTVKNFFKMPGTIKTLKAAGIGAAVALGLYTLATIIKNKISKEA